MSTECIWEDSEENPVVPDDPERALEELYEDAKSWSLDGALAKKPDITRQDLEDLRKWCIENEFTEASDYELIAFLHSCHGDIDRVHAAVRVYHATRSGTPEVYQGIAFSAEDIQKAKDVGYCCILPNKTPEGYRIILQGLRNPDPADYVYVSAIRSQILVIDSCIRADPTSEGYVMLNDMKGATMYHMWKQNFRLAKKLMTYFQEGLPLRMQRIHVVNASPLVDVMMRVMRPLIRSEVMAMFHIHTANDMENFFSMVPRDCMPEEYGGTLPSVEKLQAHTDWFLEKMEDLISAGST